MADALVGAVVAADAVLFGGRDADGGDGDGVGHEGELGLARAAEDVEDGDVDGLAGLERVAGRDGRVAHEPEEVAPAREVLLGGRVEAAARASAAAGTRGVHGGREEDGGPRVRTLEDGELVLHDARAARLARRGAGHHLGFARKERGHVPLDGHGKGAVPRARTGG